jgi:hypothetical protein
MIATINLIVSLDGERIEGHLDTRNIPECWAVSTPRK